MVFDIDMQPVEEVSAATHVGASSFRRTQIDTKKLKQLFTYNLYALILMFDCLLC